MSGLQIHRSVPFRGIDDGEDLIESDRRRGAPQAHDDAGLDAGAWHLNLLDRNTHQAAWPPAHAVETTNARFRIVPDPRARLRRALERTVFGQLEARQTAFDFMNRILDRRQKLARPIRGIRSASGRHAPRIAMAALGIVGPQGCGKSLLGRVITKGLCGDVNRCVLIEGSRLQDRGSVLKLFGSTDAVEMEHETFAPRNLRSLAPNPMDPLVIFFEEPEKAKDDVLEIVQDTLASFGAKGILEYPNSQTFSHESVVLIIETRDVKYAEQFTRCIRRHSRGRGMAGSDHVMRAVLEPLHSHDVRCIAEREFKRLEEQANQRLVARGVAGTDVIRVDPGSDVIDLVTDAFRGYPDAARSTIAEIRTELPGHVARVVAKLEAAGPQTTAGVVRISLSLRGEVLSGSPARDLAIDRLRSRTLMLSDLITVVSTSSTLDDFAS